MLLPLGAEGSRNRGLGAVNLDIPDTLVKSFGHEKYGKKTRSRGVCLKEISFVPTRAHTPLIFVYH